MIIENRSHRTNIYSKTFHDVLDTNSFAFQRGRRLAYTQRLYFEYMYTQKVKGTTFFIPLLTMMQPFLTILKIDLVSIMLIFVQ